MGEQNGVQSSAGCWDESCETTAVNFDDKFIEFKLVRGLYRLELFYDHVDNPLGVFDPVTGTVTPRGFPSMAWKVKWFRFCSLDQDGASKFATVAVNTHPL